MYASVGSVCERNPIRKRRELAVVVVDHVARALEVDEEEPREDRRHVATAPPEVDAPDDAAVVGRLGVADLHAEPMGRQEPFTGPDAARPCSSRRCAGDRCRSSRRARSRGSRSRSATYSCASSSGSPSSSSSASSSSAWLSREAFARSPRIRSVHADPGSSDVVEVRRVRAVDHEVRGRPVRPRVGLVDRLAERLSARKPAVGLDREGDDAGSPTLRGGLARSRPPRRRRSS